MKITFLVFSGYLLLGASSAFSQILDDYSTMTMSQIQERKNQIEHQQKMQAELEKQHEQIVQMQSQIQEMHDVINDMLRQQHELHQSPNHQ